VAKAIRDGVIEAVLDHENGWMQVNKATSFKGLDRLIPFKGLDRLLPF